MKLYTYFRSSAAWRARIACALKGVAYEPVFIHLLRGGGEQLAPRLPRLQPGRPGADAGDGLTARC